jgi:nucleoside phosphorylase
VTNISSPNICILFALDREARPFFQQFPIQKRFPAAPHRAFLCGKPDQPILVLETGVGLKRMEEALTWVFSQPQLPKLIISAGFSGALRDGINIADIIVATEVVDENGGFWPTSWPGEVSGHECQRGKLLTVSRAISEPGEKMALGRKHDALAVDMETAVVARMCSQRGIAFGCVRAISDDVHTPLCADLDHVIVNGQVSLWRLMTRLVRRPWFAAELWRLARHTRLAADNLAVALARLINVAADS